MPTTPESYKVFRSPSQKKKRVLTGRDRLRTKSRQRSGGLRGKRNDLGDRAFRPLRKRRVKIDKFLKNL